MIQNLLICTIKNYIGVAKGYDEDEDVQFITAFGTTFPPAAGKVLFND